MSNSRKGKEQRKSRRNTMALVKKKISEARATLKKGEVPNLQNLRALCQPYGWAVRIAPSMRRLVVHGGL